VLSTGARVLGEVCYSTVEHPAGLFASRLPFAAA
jgi:hypothetical protein